MGERLRQGLKLRNKREIGVEPLKGKNQLERLELSQTRGLNEGHSKRTGGSAVQVALEAYLRSGKNKGEIQELPKTRSLSEDHQERMRRRLQGAKRSL